MAGQINFKVSPADARLIDKIVDRAVGMFARYGKQVIPGVLSMDLTATHANGCPLRLRELLEADDSNFAHDIAGIQRHIDRKTGKLGDCFLPRFAARQESANDLVDPALVEDD